MYPSRYLLTYPVPETPGQLLLFSGRKGAMALLPERIFAEIEAGRVPEGMMDELLALRMIVPDPKQEKREMLGFIGEVNRLDTGLRVAVYLGLGCNFACTYCYEGTMKKKAWMNDATADQVIAYIKSRFTEQKKRLSLDFYGGEPLLAPERIRYIARALRPFVEERGGVFEFALVTNGSLLTPKMTADLVRYGLRGAKVTIDGPPEIHNRCRPFKNGDPSFEVILKNVKESCSLTTIGLGGNFTATNFHAFPRLFDILADHGLSGDRLGVMQFGPVIQVNDSFGHPDFQEGCSTIKEPWLVAASLALREETLKRGYRPPKIIPSPCAVEIEDMFTVHYDGTIYKCGGLIGHEEFVVGDVRTGMQDFRQTYNLDLWKDSADCLECRYLPLCFGGCRYLKYQQEGSMTGLDCMKDYLDAALGPALLQDLKYRYGMGPLPQPLG